jgi:myosin heavy subunit
MGTVGAPSQPRRKLRGDGRAPAGPSQCTEQRPNLEVERKKGEQTMTNHARGAWLLGAALVLVSAGCQDRSEQQQRSQSQSSQGQGQQEGSQASATQKAGQSLERAAEEQKQAADKQEEVASTQQELSEKREDLQQAKEKAEQTLNESQREQQEARSASQEAEQATAGAQKESATQAQREAEQTQAQMQERQQTSQAQAEQQLAQRADATSAASQKTVNGQVVRADPQELVLRQAGTTEPDLRIRIDPSTSISVDGQQGAIDALQPGMEVRASYDASGAEPKAVKIEAHQAKPGAGAK